MTNTNQRSDGRFMSGMFFHVLPGQIILALSVNCDTMDDYSKMHPRMHCYGQVKERSRFVY